MVQIVEPPPPAVTPSVLTLQPPLPRPQSQPGQARQLLINNLHIKSAARPVPLEGQRLCNETNWYHRKCMEWSRLHLPLPVLAQDLLASGWAGSSKPYYQPTTRVTLHSSHALSESQLCHLCNAWIRLQYPQSPFWLQSLWLSDSISYLHVPADG